MRKRTSRPKFDERERFNWGYHDAADEYQRGRPRLTGLFGQQTPQYVSREFDPAYYEGYVRGLRDARAGQYRNNSRPAWEEYQTEVKPA